MTAPLIPAVPRDSDLLADIRRAAAEEAECLHLWWLGQSGFLLQWKGRHLLFDPYLSDSLTKKYASTDKPHIRMSERAIDPAKLTGIDVVTSSHHHTDHLDPETLQPLLAANPEIEVVVPAAHAELAAKRTGREPGRLHLADTGQTLSVAGFTVHAVPAAHENREQDEQGHEKFLGYVVRCGPWRVYHSGDTMRFAGQVEEVGSGVDVALLPINGRAPERRVAGNLSGREAAELAGDLNAGLVIPCHYDMFTFNTASPHEFTDCCEAIGQPFRVLGIGQRVDLHGSPG